MQFPPWVLKTRGVRHQKTARLRFMLYSLALQVSPRPSLHAIRAKTGLADNSTLSLYIGKGAMSPPMAESFEKFFGSAVVKAEWLVDPMTVPACESPASTSELETAMRRVVRIGNANK